jgi:PAS domain S-box-containing protein
MGGPPILQRSRGHELAGGAPDRPALAASRRFLPEPSTVALARRFLLEQLPESSRERADELVLMVSELATNAVQHAAAPYVVSVAVDQRVGRVRVEVRDTAGGNPALPEVVGDAPHGRGLAIVAALADAWGIDMRRGLPGKAVWFSAPLPVVPSLERSAPDDSGNEAATRAAWQIRDVREVLDGLSDAAIATDEQGVICYANSAAEELVGLPAGSLPGRSALELVPDSLKSPLQEGFAEFLRGQADEMTGRRIPAVLKRADGAEVDTDLLLSTAEHPTEGPLLLGIFRPRDDGRLQRWSELTSELLELLEDAPIDDPPAERLLSTLGRRLGWDVTTLWALSANQELVCRHVWTRTASTAPAFAKEKADDPRAGSEGLPRYVIEHNEPLWVADLAGEERFNTPGLHHDGLKSAYAFPIRYRGACVGIVKMLSREARERDPAVVELMEAISGHLGELLHASTQKAEREQLLEELLDARRRNEFLLLATQVLSEVVDYRDMVQRLAQVAVPVMADLCLIDITDEDGGIRRMAAWHADPAKRELAERLRNSYPPAPGGSHPIIEVMESGRSLWGAHMSDDFLRKTTVDEQHYAIVKALGFTSYMIVPLRLRQQEVLGTVTLVSAGSGRRFSERDLGLAEQLAKQVSSVVIRARALERERRISHELQRNMLPDAIPDIDGWNVAARYLPAAVGVEVGGDWYDVVLIRDGLVALVVGDVEGHDLDAAKIMSRLRHTLALLVLEEESPGRALDRLNRVLLSQETTRLATALLGVLDTSAGAITFASAGHYAPLRVANGRTQEIPVPPGPPLGVQPTQYGEFKMVVDDGCLLMFTDGLVERRGSAIDERMSQLSAFVREAPSTHPDALADFLLEAMTADERSADDVVVLTACLARSDLAGPAPA